jgi:predicted Zn-dependent protease
VLLGGVYLMRRQYDLALVELERAIAVNPNHPSSRAGQGLVYVWSGHPDGAILALEATLRFDPKMRVKNLSHLGMAYYLKGRYGDAVQVLEQGLRQNPHFSFGQALMAATYGQLGRTKRAARAAAALRRLDPFFSTKEFGRLFRRPSDAALLVDGLRKAGLD